MLLRFAGLLFFLAALWLGWGWFKERASDPGSVRVVDTKDMIAAVEFKDEGQQAVIFKPNGDLMANEGYGKGNIDKDIVWQPNGNALFFISDRKDRAFHIFRWNPGFEPEARSYGTRSRGNPWFSTQQDDETANNEALITSGGKVLSFDPKTTNTRQMLPPVGREVSQASGDEAGAGSGSQFDGVYKAYGDSFKYARWCGNKQFIAAVIRGDTNEVLIVQNMSPKTEREQLPVPVAAGEKIDVDVNPKDGSLVFAVMNFSTPDGKIPPQWIKNGKVTKPFEHLLARIDPTKEQAEPIATSNSNDSAFGSPRISPDGAAVLVAIGSFVPGSGLEPKGLFSMPNAVGGGQAAARLAIGAIFEPSWSPDGTRIAYAKRVDGKRAIFTSSKDGSGERNVSGSKGNFGSPLFSPQKSG
ncbi:MAG: TolB family protein [Fimbriimonas sp.]